MPGAAALAAVSRRSGSAETPRSTARRASTYPADGVDGDGPPSEDATMAAPIRALRRPEGCRKASGGDSEGERRRYPIAPPAKAKAAAEERVAVVVAERITGLGAGPSRRRRGESG